MKNNLTLAKPNMYELNTAEYLFAPQANNQIIGTINQNFYTVTEAIKTSARSIKLLTIERSPADAGKDRRTMLKLHCQAVHSRSWRRQPKRLSYQQLTICERRYNTYTNIHTTALATRYQLKQVGKKMTSACMVEH